MFARPRPTTTPRVIRPATSRPSRGSRPAARLQRPGSNRAGYVERTVTTSDGVRLAARDYGLAAFADHTVVLMHGLLLTQESWADQVRQLQRRWGSSVRVITYDHRGHGRSNGASTHTYRIERLAADLAEVLTALQVSGPLTLAGHSMGGMTALAYFGRPPPSVRWSRKASSWSQPRAAGSPSEDWADCLALPRPTCCSIWCSACPDGPPTR
jgi:alpha-beta hydrolase superfamily lysophospholipase